MIMLNNYMKWFYITGAIIAIWVLSGLFEKVDAQENPPTPKERPFEWTPKWQQKPISCAPLDQIAQIAKSKGLQIVWSGTGVGNSENLGIVRVDIFLSVNPETKEWALTEISPTPNVGCLIGYGAGFKIDSETMKLFAEPKN